MNLCRMCGEDFGSLAAFDRHKIGTHEYTSTEGLKRDPPMEDGRRCLSRSEMNCITNSDGSKVFKSNTRGRWSVSMYVKEEDA